MNSSTLVQQGSVSSQGEIGHESETMAKSLDALRSAIGDLESRLIPILAERKEETGAQGSQPEPVRVPLAQKFHDFNLALADTENRLRSIISRIEL